MNATSLLLADNNIAFLKATAERLSDAGYKVIQVSSFDMAEKVLNREDTEIDLAILDVRLIDDDNDADMSGLKLAEKVNQSTPKIMITGRLTPEINRRIGVVAAASFPAPVGLVEKNQGEIHVRLLQKIQAALEPSKDASPVEPVIPADQAPLSVPVESKSHLTSRDELINEIDKLLDRHKEDFVNGPMFDQIKRALREVVSDEIKSLLLGPVLDNYEGFVCAEFTGQGTRIDDNSEKNLPIFKKGQDGCLVVWLQPGMPEDVVADPVDILDGQDSGEATFQVKLESDTVDFKLSNQTVTVRNGESSTREEFSFIAPEESGEHSILIQVLQKNRLIQILRMQILIET